MERHQIDLFSDTFKQINEALRLLADGNFFSSPEPKAPGELMDRQLSVVVVFRMTSTLSNNILSEANEPFKPKFHHQCHSWAGGLKVCFFFMKTGI